MNRKIYIETSVISYYVSEPSENIRIAGHQISTIHMWKELSNYRVFVSDVVIDEISKGNTKQAELRIEAIVDFKVLEIDNKTRDLARSLILKHAIPKKNLEDALHIAVAAVNTIEILVTWNFKHINNPFLINKIRKVIENEGYKNPIICSPDELIGGIDD